MGLFSKIFKGIKKVVKGVAKGIKKVVKGVAKVVKKVAKSKIFKAVLAAAAIYVTGGAALKGFGVTGGKLGAWAAKSGSGIFSSGLGKAIATPFRFLGTGLGKGARAITDFTGITEKGAQLGADSIMSPTQYNEYAKGTEIATAERGIATAERATQAIQMAGPNATATEVATAARGLETAASATASLDPYPNIQPIEVTGQMKEVTKGSSWGTFGKTVGTNVVTNVASGYALSKLTEEDPTGQMSGLALEGPSNLDPLAIYGQNGQPLSIAEAYGQLLYGTADPMYNQGNTSNLYTQDIAPVPAA